MAQNADLLQGQQPLQGLILCCTAVPQDVRTRLAEIATQMGAVPKLDLTSDVTHLIVGNITTPKYQYVARERPDIKVLFPAWLEDIRESWMEGGDVDIAALERKHRCPPFFGLHICLTGFEDIEQRTYISSTVTEQGATYHGDLTKTVTHLIAAAPKGQKYTHGKRWGIPVVSLKWFEDSLRRGMALDENLYDPTAPLEEQGKGAYKRQRTSLGKHTRDSDVQKGSNSDLARKRLRRTASTRLESQSQDMWQDMSAEPLKTNDADADSWNDDGDDSTTNTLTGIPRRDSEKELADVLPDKVTQVDAAAEALFSGYHVLIHGFEQHRTSLLESVLLENGATMADTAAQLEDASAQPFFKGRCLLVPHAVHNGGVDLPEVPATTIVGTEWWVERSILSKRVLDPTEDALSSPLWNVEVSGFTSLLISTTGFSGLDLRQIAKTVKLMGGTYQEKVLPTSSVLVSGSTSIKREKAFYASKHRIPIVSADWLWACLKSKQIMPFQQYKIDVPTLDASDFNGDYKTSGSTPKEMQRRKDENGNLRDSRNDESVRLSSSRKYQRKQALALHARKVGTSSNSPLPKSTVHEDDDTSFTAEANVAQQPVMFDAADSESQPLREVSSNRSPGTRNNDDMQGVSGGEIESAKAPSQPVSPSKASSAPIVVSREAESRAKDAPLPATRSHHELTADLADLLNRTGASRTSSGASADMPLRRKNRPLGRASSGTSTRSLSASAMQETFTLVADGDMSGVEGVNAGSDGLPPPSTQLGYETPETKAHRMQMSKKMGMKLHDEADMRRVPSLGVVKDMSLMADSGVGNRVKGRGRAK